MVCPMSGAIVGVSFSSYRDLLAYQVSWLWREYKEKLPTVCLKWLHSCQEVKVYDCQIIITIAVKTKT